uniref:Beta-glucuronosyltransferase GlcAT14B-like n=1 Tax=Cucumis melo TaxID=3656 RepID=A0A9I9D5S2_CUCME
MIGRKANVGGFLNPPWMRKNMNSHLGRMFSDRKWIVPFFASLLISVTLLLTATLGLFIPSQSDEPLPLDAVSFANEEDSSRFFIEPELRSSLKETSGVVKMEPPRLAYLISGTKGDIRRMMRTLQAVYHPRNQYVLHMDLEAPPRERLELTNLVKADSTFNEVENVRVMAQSNLVTYKGPTMIACTLQAISVLLRESLDWDWFINLSASDYPLMTQDDLFHVFSNITRNFNFIEHS